MSNHIEVPKEFAGEVGFASDEKLRLLYSETNEMAGAGSPREFIVAHLVSRLDWTREFAEWYVDVAKSHGTLKLHSGSSHLHSGSSHVGSGSTRQREPGLMEALFDFRFDSYAIIVLVRAGYRLVFLALTLSFIAGSAVLWQLAEQFGRGGGTWIGIASIAALAAILSTVLLFCRIWFEAQIVHYKGPQDKR